MGAGIDPKLTPAASVLLPADVVERIRDYRANRRTGQITLNFSDGRIANMDAREYLRVADIDPQASTGVG